MKSLERPSIALANDFLEFARNSVAGIGTILQPGGPAANWKNGIIDFDTHYGPVEQDKECNQDFVLGCIPVNPQSEIDWVLVMADGVSSSWRSDVASRLACWTGLAALLSSSRSGEDLAKQATNVAGRTIEAVARTIEQNHEVNRPDGEFSSTWQYMIRKGILLQTTLSLAWMNSNVIHLAMVGDGGAMVRDQSVDDRVSVFGSELQGTNRVHAIGPRNPNPTLDHYHELQVDGPVTATFYTDGVGRGLQTRERDVFWEYECARCFGDHQCVSGNLIESWIESDSKAFEDNLTIAFVSNDSGPRGL